MAPAALSAPAPCVKASVPVTSNDVNSSSALTVFGVSFAGPALPAALAGVQDQRDGAARHRRGHARPAQARVGQRRPSRLLQTRPIAAERAVGADRGHEPMARRDEVGLGVAVVPGRTARAVARDPVVETRGRVARVERADGDRRRRVAGRGDAGVAAARGLRQAAEVAGRDDHDQAGAHGRFDGLDQRIAIRRLVDRVAERQVEDAQAQRVAVGDGVLDGREHVAGAAGAVGIEHLQADQSRSRRDAAVLCRSSRRRCPRSGRRRGCRGRSRRSAGRSPCRACRWPAW